MVDIGGGPAPTSFPFSARTNLLAARVLEATNIGVFRLSKGRIARIILGFPVILLTTSGATTGARHTKPLVALEDGISWVVAGPVRAFSHDPRPGPEWYENLLAYEDSQIADRSRPGNAPLLIAPEVEYSGNRRVAVRSEPLAGEEHAKWWTRIVEAHPRLNDPNAGRPPVMRLTPLGY